MTARAVMRVYIFHSCQLRALVMSPFFRPYELYDDIILDDVHLSFHTPMYPTDRESNSDTHLTLTYFVKSNPLEPLYPFDDLLNFGFLFFCCEPSTIPGLWTRVHSYPSCAPWAWMSLWKITWRWRTRRLREQIRSILMMIGDSTCRAWMRG